MDEAVVGDKSDRHNLLVSQHPIGLALLPDDRPRTRRHSRRDAYRCLTRQSCHINPWNW
ncbi:hypothetical protein QT979_03545 [Microcoleus sp. w2-18bC1]|uniref:hypothetical protein n=1 Tax=unclassified Microcoleus TaxID=2642155 RepID=UPI002FD68312